MVLYCRECESPNTFDRNWIKDEDACKYCGAAGKWRTVNEPKVDYTLSHNDRRFLRSIRVEAE